MESRDEMADIISFLCFSMMTQQVVQSSTSRRWNKHTLCVSETTYANIHRNEKNTIQLSQSLSAVECQLACKYDRGDLVFASTIDAAMGSPPAKAAAVADKPSADLRWLFANNNCPVDMDWKFHFIEMHNGAAIGELFSAAITNCWSAMLLINGCLIRESFDQFN